MIRTFFVDGDKGGVGKSTVARALVDMLIQAERFDLPKIDRIVVIDADPSNDDVCGPGGYINEVVGETEILAVRFPISVIDDWKDLIDYLASNGLDGANENLRIVFSLPAGAGFVLLQNPVVFEMLSLFNGVPVWVLGNEESSVDQLQKRIDAAPLQHEKGFVIRNLKHGTAQSFSAWNNSQTKKTVMDWGWQEVDFPVGMSSVMTDIGRTPAHHAVTFGTGSNGKKLGAGTDLFFQSFRDVTCNRLSVLEKTIQEGA